MVTGAASGLGRAIALGLDAQGASVVLADQNRAGVDEVRAELRQTSYVVQVDVTDPAAVRVMTDEAEQRFGSIDIAFVLPGINVRKAALDLSDEEWSRVVDLNLSSTFTSAREIGRTMVAQGHGSMILMASARGLVGGRNQAVYSATKAGIIGLMRCLAWEWAPLVRVNALAPGYMATPLVAPMTADAERWRATETLHALGRVGDPEEIVGPAIFLASDASSFVTGTVLTVDGGWTAGAP
jgi:NAD(P)-dependent dehydrogenase (short-subunit alcohol dehydrogenase family)